MIYHGALRSAGIILADSGAGEVMRNTERMPDVPGPDAAVPFPGFAMEMIVEILQEMAARASAAPKYSMAPEN